MYSQFMMHGQKNMKLWIHLDENEEKSLELLNTVLNLQVGNLSIS